MSVEAITATAGVVLAILFEYVPGLKDWYGALKDNYQRLVMLGVLLAVVAGAFGLSCYGKLAYFECSEAGVWAAIQAFIAALVANQSTHRILPR